MTLDEFTAYFRQHSEALRTTAGHLLTRMRCQGDAEEVVNQAYVQLHRRHEAINLPEADRYIFRVLQNVIRDMGRAQARDQRIQSLDEQAGQVVGADPTDEGNPASVAECEATVVEALAELTAAERQALRLFLANDRATALLQMAGYDAAINRAKQKLRRIPGGLRDAVLRLGMDRVRDLLNEPPAPES